MRLRVRDPSATLPSRGSSSTLTLPPPIKMNDFLQISGEATTAILRKSEEIQLFKWYLCLYKIMKINHTHSLTNSLTYSLTHKLTHKLTHSLTHSLSYSLTHSFIHWLTDSVTHSLTDSITHSLTNLLTNLLTQRIVIEDTHSPVLLFLRQ